MLKKRVREEIKHAGITRWAYGLHMRGRAALASEPVDRWYWRCRQRAIVDAPASALGGDVQTLSTELSRSVMVKRLGRDHYGGAAGPLTRTILLKAPGEGGEKGVIVSYFEYNWLRMLREIPDYADFCDRYQLVFSSSWSPTDYGLLSIALASSPEPIVVQPCNYGEIPKLDEFHERLHCTDSLPCDWIDPNQYDPRPDADRDVDIVMVANWAPFKRHWHFFRVLKQMRPDLNVVLIGQPQDGCTRQDIERMILDYGLKQEFLIRESIPISEVTDFQCRSKIGAIFTKREGCCVSVVETLFANTPMALLETAHIGPLRYINDETGCRLKAGMEARQLTELIERRGEMKPREWATHNVAHTITTAKLNDQLKQLAQSTGRPWTRDLALPVWRPYPIVADAHDREQLKPACEALHSRYPDLFGEEFLRSCT